MCENRTWHQHFCCRNVPTQWVFCNGWLFLHLLSQCKADLGCFLFHFCKVCLWLWIVNTCLMKKLSLESSWSHFCVGTILWLLTALTYSIWYGKLHWFIPDKRVFWFPDYCITTEGEWIPHCVSGCVCATLLCHSLQCAHNTLGRAQGAQQDTPSGFPGQSCLLAPLELSEDMPVSKNGQAWWQWFRLVYKSSLLTHWLHFSSLSIILIYFCAHQNNSSSIRWWTCE